jgi:hypothetical protein
MAEKRRPQLRRELLTQVTLTGNRFDLRRC